MENSIPMTKENITSGQRNVRNLAFYNTLTRSEQRFEPITPGRVGIYCCGPTVYNYAHIGNLRAYIFEDLLVRTLRQAGYKVRHVMNITDVGHLQSDADDGEDKMVIAAEREQRSPWEIARYYENAFFDDCDALHIDRPDIVCRATEHIDDIIAFIEKLTRTGYAYEIEGNIYFDVSRFPRYYDLRGGVADGSITVSRVEADPRKRQETDFVLWFSKSKFPRQTMKWESPWGVGFPGWHIECSAMASKYLGSRIDIHCGGIDHIPIHHTNEIAQSECYHGHRWANNWMHGNFLVLDKGKMSKSANTFITLQAVREQGFKPLHYRYLCLTTRYRSELKFSWEALDGARRGLEKLYNRIIAVKLASTRRAANTDAQKREVERYRAEFWAALADDLNTPIGLSILWRAIKDPALGPKEKLKIAGEFDRFFGLGLLDAKAPALPEKLMVLIREREAARETKDWRRADTIRAQLEARRVIIKDTEFGTQWYYAIDE